MFANVPADVWWVMGGSAVILLGLGYLLGRELTK